MSHWNAAIVLGLSLGASSASALAAEGAARHWHFAALLDGRPIGFHDFSVVQQGDDLVVDTSAHFQVRAAFIPLYGYDHRDHEVWRNGCLTSLSSRTDDNGKKLTVQGALKGHGFEVSGVHGARSLPECVMTFAYWDPQFLRQTRLLNSQTGEFDAVTVSEGAAQTVTIGGQSVSAQHYTVRAPDVVIDLWYSSVGEWLALESRLKSGRTLRYESH